MCRRLVVALVPVRVLLFSAKHLTLAANARAGGPNLRLLSRRPGMASTARVGLAPYRRGERTAARLIKPSRTNVHQHAMEIFLVRFAVLILSLLCGLAGSAAAQIGAMSPSKETDRFRAPNAQIECGPIGCRPLPSGCRQVSLGGRWIDNNGRRVVCDNKKN